MRRQVFRFTRAQADVVGAAPPASSQPIPPAAVDEGVAAVAAACRGRRGAHAGLEAAIGHICRTAGLEVGHVYLSDTDTGRLLPGHIWYLEPPASRFTAFVRTTAASELVPGQGLPGQVVSTGAPVFIEPLPISAHMPRARAAIASGLRAACGFPLEANARLTVVLEFLARHSIEPSRELHTLVERLADALRPCLADLEAPDLQ